MKEMTVVKTENGETTIRLTGEIDASNAEVFFAETMAVYGAGVNLTFDCEELAFIDSTTLGTFVKIFKTVKAGGKQMKIVNLPQKIKKLFVICALDTMMEIS